MVSSRGPDVGLTLDFSLRGESVSTPQSLLRRSSVGVRARGELEALGGLGEEKNIDGSLNNCRKRVHS